MKTPIISLAFGIAALGTRAALADETGERCSDAALGVTRDLAGRTLVVGAAYDNRIIEWDGGHAHYGDLAIARLRRGGELDASFGRGGTLISLPPARLPCLRPSWRGTGPRRTP